MPTFSYDKLVRNKIPDFHREAGHDIVVRRLRVVELAQALAEKLKEEASEVVEARTTDGLKEEIADVQQVIDDLCIISGISKQEIFDVMSDKAENKGNFLAGQYVETVTMPNEDDEWVAYCRGNPEKYPEIG